MIQHINLSRFCCRGLRRASAGDPLEDDNVMRRLQLLRTAPVPSLSSQTTDACTWVVVFDRDLRPALRAEIEDVVGRVPGSVTVPLDSQRHLDRFTRFDLIAPLAGDADRPLVTTWLDDDDVLADGYIETVQRDVAARLDRDDGTSSSTVSSSRRDRLRHAPGGYGGVAPRRAKDACPG